MAFSPRTWILSGVAVLLIVAVAFAYHFSKMPATEDAPVGSSSLIAENVAPTPKNIPALAALLQNSDPAQAMAAADRLSQIHTPEAAAPLLAAANDPRPPVQAAVINALVSIQPKMDPAPFMQIVESTPHPAVRAAALDLLAVQKVAAAASLMLKYLDDPDVEVRGRAYAGIRAITGRNYNFHPDDTPEKRHEAVGRMRDSVVIR